MKLFINYKKKDSKTKGVGKDERDLRIIYSQTNPKPEANNCDGIAENVACLSLNATGGERYFSKEYLFLKFETISGQQANLKL